MLFSKKKQTAHKIDSDTIQNQEPPIPLQAHKYSIRFDILPEISYLNDPLCVLLADFFPLFRGFPEKVWISQQGIQEGLDFCSVNFWVFSEAPDAIKEFSIWFQGIFREEQVSRVLESFVQHTLEKPDEVEVILADWSRIHTEESEIRKSVEQEMMKHVETEFFASRHRVSIRKDR